MRAAEVIERAGEHKTGDLSERAESLNHAKGPAHAAGPGKPAGSAADRRRRDGVAETDARRHEQGLDQRGAACRQHSQNQQHGQRLSQHQEDAAGAHRADLAEAADDAADQECLNQNDADTDIGKQPSGFPRAVIEIVAQDEHE